MEVVFQESLTLARGEVEHDVTLPAGSLAGRVTTANDGAGVAEVALIAERKFGERWDFAARIYGETDGSYRIPYLPDGEYRVSALPQDGVHAVAMHDPVSIVGARAQSSVDFALVAGARLSLHVEDAQENPVADADVRVTDASGNSLQLRQAQITGAHGTLELFGLPSGRATIAIVKSGFESSRDEIVLLTGETFDLRVTLRPSKP
jgi:hypothetical protein